MWVCFNDAFVSAVQAKDDPNKLSVRARKREHLETLFPDVSIQASPTTDYAYRVYVSKDAFAKLLVERVNDIQYGNFKDSVADKDLHNLYLDFWKLHAMYQWDDR